MFLIFLGPVTRYFSTDTAVDEDSTIYAVEFLNTLNPPGCSTHILELKVGLPIMLLRNINPSKLVNRLCIDKLFPKLIVATVLTGTGKGEQALIPRIPLIPNDDWIQFQRVQFLVRVTSAMSIKKAQGQTIKHCGVNLSEQCFSHGQLYEALSQVGSPSNFQLFKSNM